MMRCFIRENKAITLRLGLTCQICDSGYETMITQCKINQNKLWSLIFNQSNIEGWNWKKIQLKMT
jgi:hypothetical protein